MCVDNLHRIKAVSLVNLRESAVQTPEKKVKLELCICCVCKLLPIACTHLECRSLCNICLCGSKKGPRKDLVDDKSS